MKRTYYFSYALEKNVPLYYNSDIRAVAITAEIQSRILYARYICNHLLQLRFAGGTYLS